MVVARSASGRRVLVLGGGFIGSAVTRALVAHGHSVTVLTRSQPPVGRRTLMTGANLVIGETSRTELLANLLSRTDDVIYCVGSSTPVESEVDPANDIPLVLPPLVRVLELIRLHPTTRLTFLSSGGTVYGNVEQLPIEERSPLRPISSYGILKVACENYIAMYTDVHGVEARVFRVSNPYGAIQDWRHGQGLIARMMYCAQTGDPLTLYSWGQPVRDYIYIDDLAEVIARSVETPHVPAILNIGSGVGHSTLELADLVREVTGRGFEVRLEGSRGYDVEANVLDVTAAAETLGLTTRDLREGLRLTWTTLTSTPLSLVSPRASGSSTARHA